MYPFTTVFTSDHLVENTSTFDGQYQTSSRPKTTGNGDALFQTIVGQALNQGTLAFIRLSLLSVIALTMVSGNALTLWAVVSNDRLRIKTYALTTSLAFADLAVGIAMISYVSHEVASQSSCGLATFRSAVRPIEKLLIYVSVLHISAIAVDRFLAIVYPLSYENRMSSSTIKITVVVLWLVAAAVSLPPYFGFLSIIRPQSCIVTLWPVFETVVEVTIYSVNSLTVGFVYLRIWLTAVHQETQQLQQLRQQQEPAFSLCVHPTAVVAADAAREVNSTTAADGSTPHQPRGDNVSTAIDKWWRFRSAIIKHRSTKTVMIILLLYVVFWFPYFLSRLLGAISGPNVSIATFQTVASVIALSNLSMNVFVYSGTNRDFRRAYKNILCIRAHAIYPCVSGV